MLAVIIVPSTQSLALLLSNSIIRDLRSSKFMKGLPCIYLTSPTKLFRFLLAIFSTRPSNFGFLEVISTMTISPSIAPLSIFLSIWTSSPGRSKNPNPLG